MWTLSAAVQEFGLESNDEDKVITLRSGSDGEHDQRCVFIDNTELAPTQVVPRPRRPFGDEAPRPHMPSWNTLSTSSAQERNMLDEGFTGRLWTIHMV